MGKKDGELWDDSALIDAFQDAISTYKKMHGMKQIDGFEVVESLVGDAVDHEQITAEEEEEDAVDLKSHVDKSTSDASNSILEVISVIKDERVDEYDSNGTLGQERAEGDSDLQPDADYNSLVNQYYELQEKLQLTWQQLQQCGYSSDQYPQYTAEVGLSDTAAGVKEAPTLSSDAVEQNSDAVGRKPDPCQQLLPCGCVSDQCSCSAGVQGTCSLFQGQSTKDSGSQPTAVCCFYPCTDKCVVSSSCPANVCILCKDAVPGCCPEKSHTLGDDDLIKVAMGAAEKAISSIKIQTADLQEGSGDISVDSLVKSSGNNGCGTDISTVLNAWFSAGLVTGKYLAEQSNSKRQNG